MGYTQPQVDYIVKRCQAAGLEPEKVFAFLKVETGNVVYTKVNGKDEPLIRLEGHYFKKYLSADKLARAVKAGLAGAYKVVKNPASQVKRYERLAECKKIDYDAAIMSHSWGVGQVMGDHWKKLGYLNAREFETKLRSGFEGQFDAVWAYLVSFNILPHLKRGDWSAVAALYNGPDYKSNNYDKKMRDEYERLIKRKQPDPTSSGMVRAGSKGPRVREVQNMLKLQGFTLNVDGDFGASTQNAVRKFQLENGLEVDGVVGPKTYAALSAVTTTDTKQLEAVPVTTVKEVQVGVAGGVGGAVFIQTAKSTINEALEQVVSVPGLEKVAAGLTVLSVVVVLGGLAYSAWGWFKATRNNLGLEDAT